MTTEEEPHEEGAQVAAQDEQKQSVEPAAPTTVKKRPRLDLTNATGNNRDRKRGKSMFGILLGTLNKAKIEDKERNASEAAKKRQLTEQRLQIKLKKETESVRRAEEAKKDKTTANRKEEELQLKDSIYKLRRTRLPLVANFLLTSDTITSDDSSPSNSNPLAQPPRTHPPPLYYLPAILTPEQEAFITRRKAEVQEAAEQEWHRFREERTAGIAEVNSLRQRVAEEEAKRKAEKETEKDNMEADHPSFADDEKHDGKTDTGTTEPPAQANGTDMDVDSGSGTQREENKEASEQERKEEPAPMQPDDEDAVEY
ncbi:hypothetical protein M378DRAFT_193196 [Amanita muscaria Koide BX008]|uniref:Pinin/SDK/MemA protein domain-containing protein n=1 Tax=Amanita muscaria (strain Koide BX008) TaxID=946122 RepID=A0A0C2X1A0_AMAMK|nr:hypothetical protein M378DRAFT_193196 [Amanita muscaria Koide BX008]